MTTRTLQILLALAEGPLHGYGIKQRVEERTDGEVRLGSGTLYEAVHRLLGQGMLEEVDAPDQEPSSGGPPRRFYALTTLGHTALADELRRMDAVVRFARDRDLLPEIGGGPWPVSPSPPVPSHSGLPLHGWRTRRPPWP